MRSFGRFFVLVFLVFALLSSPATAMQIQKTQTIKVTAKVAAAKYVYVNEQMRIVKIVNNSENPDAPLRVISDKNPTAELQTTDQITEQYNELAVRHELDRYGEVYNQASLEPVTTQSRPNLARFGLQVLRVSAIF